jgi:hypothetical protein
MRVPEPLFKEFVYNAAPSSCFVVGKEQGPVLKPAWGDGLWWTQSRYTIICETLVAVDRIVPSLDDMCLEDEDFKYTPTIFPKGTTSRGCARTHIYPVARESAAGHSPFSCRTMRHQLFYLQVSFIELIDS